MNADIIRRRVIDAFGSAISYKNSGTIKKGSQSTTFRIWFRKPDSLRFEWVEEFDWSDTRRIEPVDPPRRGTSAVICNKGVVYLKRFYEGPKTEQTLAEALQESIPYPFGAAATPAALFMSSNPNRWDWANPGSIRDLKTGEPAELDGTVCFTLQGTLHNPDDVEIWVSVQNFMIRRIRQKDWFWFGQFERSMKLAHADELEQNVCSDVSDMPFGTDCLFNSAELDGSLPDDIFELLN